jgi:hypothetical protein
VTEAVAFRLIYRLIELTILARWHFLPPSIFFYLREEIFILLNLEDQLIHRTQFDERDAGAISPYRLKL